MRPRLHRFAVPVSRLIPNDPLRTAFERSTLTAYELAQRVGVMRKYSEGAPVCLDGEVIRRGRWGGDATAALRDLGLVPQTGGSKGTTRRRINTTKALRYADALGLDPSELGL